MMNKFICCFLVTFIALTTNVYADSASHDLTELLRNIHTMQADFDQKIMNKSSQLVRNTEGSMALQRPGMFRWDVKKPISQLIIANGKKLWIYDKDLEQVVVRSLASGAGETPALLLSDANLTLENDFVIKQTTAPSAASQSFFLVPKDKSSLFASVRISFNNQILNEMQLQDHLGQTIVIKFFNIKTNVNLSSSLFNFKVPANVDLIDETKKKHG